MTGVNLLSTRSFGEFEFWFALIKVAAIVTFIMTAAAWVFGLTSQGAPTWIHLYNGGGFAPRGVLAVMAAVTTVFFSLTGAEITVVAAAESREPLRAVARMSTTVIARILIFYVGSILLIVAVVPWQQVVPGQSPFTLAMAVMHYRWAGAAMTMVILTAVLSCLNSAFYVTSRVLFAMAASGDAPASLVKLNHRGVPTRSVLLGGAAGLSGVALATISPQPSQPGRLRGRDRGVPGPEQAQLAERRSRQPAVNGRGLPQAQRLGESRGRHRASAGRGDVIQCGRQSPLARVAQRMREIVRDRTTGQTGAGGRG